MARSDLIKDATRAQRKAIIRRVLSRCGNSSCENCGSCSLGAGDPFGTYQAYIDGEKEIPEISMEIAEHPRAIIDVAGELLAHIAGHIAAMPRSE